MIRNLETEQTRIWNVPHGRTAGNNRLSPEMKSYLTDTLGIRSDVDLRSAKECYGMTGSPMGDKATWFHISSSYAGMQKDWGKEQFTKVFKVFLDEKNYPIDFHCIAGQDRTGAVAFIINGLLKVPVDSLYLDWEVTGFWNQNPKLSHKNRFYKLTEGFEALPGETMHDKIENYVLGLGFTQDDIAKLRNLLLE